MLIVLPPSETKVSGGDEGSRLDLGALSFPIQTPTRALIIEALVALAADPDASLRALKLGPKGLAEVARNRELWEAPLLPALLRYTGVLYDALGFATLDATEQKRALDSVAVFSALFGLIRASDRIPAYRVSFDSTVPGAKPGRVWPAVATELWGSVDEFVLDLRSEGYRNLAPLPEDKGVFVSLVKGGPSGSRVALGHHNKATKGRLVRDLVHSGAVLSSVQELCEWGSKHGYAFDPDSERAGSIDLVVDL